MYTMCSLVALSVVVHYGNETALHYQGCYEVRTERDLFELVDFSSNTPKKCVTHCKQLGKLDTISGYAGHKIESKYAPIQGQVRVQ